MRVICLNKDGYDPFIDFVKGLCILFVLLTHSLPQSVKDYTLFCLWGGAAVPIFLMIQVFHSYKRGLDSKKKIITVKMVKRIIFPFILTLLVILGVSTIKSPESFTRVLRWLLTGGGGRGSYYPWIYIQFAVLLALFRPIFRNMGERAVVCFLLLLSIFLEIVCCVTEMSLSVYRLLCFRYVFLIALGLDWVLSGVRLDLKRIALSLVSVFCMVYFYYVSPNLEPVFFPAWKPYHWICYFFPAYVLMFALKMLHVLMEKWTLGYSFILKCGKYSYEIFLFQMIVFNFVHKEWFSFVELHQLQFVIWFVFVNFMSVIPVVLLKSFMEKRKKNVV